MNLLELANWCLEDVRERALRGSFWLWKKLRKYLLYFVDSSIDLNTVAEEEDKGDKRHEHPPLDGSKLSFFDNFTVVNGIPVFYLDPESIATGLTGQDAEVVCCCMSHDGSRMLSGHKGGSIIVWDTDHGTVVNTLHGKFQGSVAAIQFWCESNYRAVACDFEGKFMVFDLDDDNNYSTTNCSSIWGKREDTNIYSPVVQWPTFSRNSQYLLYPVKVAVEDAPAVFNTQCHLYIFSIQEPNGMNGGGHHQDLKEPETLLDIPIRTDIKDYDMATPSFSDDETGLIIGCNTVPNGFVAAWPDFVKSPLQSYFLEGLVGCWGPRKKVVTWNTPLGPAHKNMKGACILWDLSKADNTAVLRSANMHPYLIPERGQVIRDPDGHPIGWCEFDRGRNDWKLLTVSLGNDMRIIIWDCDNSTPLQILLTGVSTGDTMLNDRTTWDMKWLHRKPAPGLSSFSVSPSSSWLAFYSHSASKGMLWDVETGFEMIQFSDVASFVPNPDMQDVDLLFSGSGNKLAMCSTKALVVWNPRVLDSQSSQGVHVMELECDDSNIGAGGVICKFSADGESVGLLRPFSTVMSVWNLRKGVRMTISNEQVKKAVPSIQSLTGMSRKELRRLERNFSAGARMCEFALSDNGRMLVTCMADMSLLLWQKDVNDEVINTTQEFSIRLKSKYSPAWAVCFSRDANGNKCVVVCEDTGFLVWISFREEVPVERRDGCGRRSCNFNADGTRAVLMPDLQRVYIWDLVRRWQLQALNFHIWLGGGFPELQYNFPVNLSMSGGFTFVGINELADSEGDRMVTCPTGPVMNSLYVTSVPRNVSIADNDQWIVLDQLVPINILKTLGKVLASSSLTKGGSKKGNSEKEGEGNVSPIDAKFPPRIMDNDNRWASIWRRLKSTYQETNQLVVMPLDGRGTRKVLQAPKLKSYKFMVLSPDGRRLACMGKGNKLMVFDAYATEGCIPDQQALVVGNMEHHKATVEDLLEAHGPALLNYPDYCGRTIMMYAVKRKNHEILTWILSWAKDRGHKVGLEMPKRYQGADGNGRSAENALKVALDYRSPECAQVILTYLLDGISCGTSASDIFKDTLVHLGKVYPRLFYQVLMHKEMLYELKEISVPEHVFLKSSFKAMSDDRMMINKKDLEDIWHEHAHREDHETFRFIPLSMRSQKLVPARPYVITYPGIARMGPDGILQQLLLHHAPNNIYGFLPLRCVISLKWKMYAERLLIQDLIHYIVLLVMYTAYSYLLGFTEDNAGIHTVFQGKTSRLTVASAAFLIGSAAISAGNLIREVKQITVLRRDARARGLWYWMITPWNWLEVVSYALLTFIIPAMHFSEQKKRYLTSLVATEAILVWSKMLYFAQAFKKTGPSVIMIREIVKDILFFLVMAFSVLFGFGVAFFVLYREKRFERCDLFTGSQMERCLSDKEELETTFSGPGRSLLTMFAWMLGELQLEALFIVDGSIRVVAITLFIAYLMSLMIVLLNLLIAIMGDSYDRVKNTEETKFLKERAEVILDMETMLSDVKKKEIQEKLGKFLHVLFPKYQQSHLREPEWQGRVRDMQRSIKREMQQGMEKISGALEGLENRQRAIEKHLKMQTSGSGVRFAAGLRDVRTYPRSDDESSDSSYNGRELPDVLPRMDRSMRISPRSSGFFEDYNFGDSGSVHEDTTPL